MPEFEVAARRLNQENPGLGLNASDAFYLMMGASFELSARGLSPWLNVFTNEEFVAFEYAMGLFFYCNFGPLSDTYGLPIGSVYANATLTLLNQDAEQNGGSLFFSFSHDSYITMALAAFGVLIAPEDPPLDQVDFAFMRTFKLTDIVPMGARLTIERLKCSTHATAPYRSDTRWQSAFAPDGTAVFRELREDADSSSYVRLVLNEAILPYDGCTDGPGWSCPLDKFTTLVRDRINKFDYVKDCAIPGTAPQHLDFFWNWNKTTRNNFHNGTYGYQATNVRN
jgi:acid phosphatase